jgi:putative peptide zinc metalloprotease protein
LPDNKLPKLRENLSIYPEDGEKGNSNNWLIYDNIIHRFYQIGYLEYLILSMWHLRDKDKIISSLQNVYKKTVTSEHFDEFFQFLVTSRLLQYSNYTTMFGANKKSKPTFLSKFQKLFFYRIHLIRPEKILKIILPYCKWMFTKTFHFIMFFIIFIGIFGIIRNFESYLSTFTYFFNVREIGLWVLSIIIVKIVHEFSHALTSKYYGCNVSSMGVAILVFWPVLFTDTTHSWSLNNRKKRILISSAGVISEVYVAAICSILWLLLPDGTLKSIAFVLSGTAWIASLFINANPFMKFDGYFVLSDIVKIPNLHQTASHYLNQYVDRHIFGVNDTKDLSYVKKSARPKLALFGLLIWIYRLFLTSVILLLIYNFAFKLLALTLMLLYITSVFIVPLIRKIKYLTSLNMANYNKKTIIKTGTFLGILLLVFLFPWRSSIEVPAIMHFKDSSVLYANSDAVVEKIYVKHGQNVQEGDILLVLNSESINYDLSTLKLDYQILKWKHKAASISKEYNAILQTTVKELDEKKSEYQSVQRRKDLLVVKAPHEGVVYLPSFHVESNTAYRKNQELLSVVNPTDYVITGYIKEDVVRYFEKNEDAYFYPDDISFDRAVASVANVSPIGIEKLEQPYLASTYGGNIAIKTKEGEEGKELIPQKGLYAITAPAKNVESYYKKDFPLIIRGVMVLESKPYSLGKAFFDFIYSGFLKHSSF